MVKLVTSTPPTGRKLRVTPLEYMLSVIGDEDADPLRRDRLAVAAAPYMHPKVVAVEDGGKKAEAERAAKREAESGSWAGLMSRPT